MNNVSKLSSLERKRRLAGAKTHVLSGRVKRGKVPEKQFPEYDRSVPKRTGGAS